MTETPEDIIEFKSLTPDQLAGLIKELRDDRKWTQATLAEIAGLTERTVQRVENGEPSSLDTRRCLAKAFEFKDLDIFNKPLPLPNIEKFNAYLAALDKTTVTIKLDVVCDGRPLRSMIETSESWATDEIGELSSAAREAFAELLDYLRDYRDVQEFYSMTDRLRVDHEIEEILRTISDGGASVGVGVRHAKLRFKSDAPGCQPMDWTSLYFILAPDKAVPPSVRVEKQVRFSCG